jgi:hypothetical protein
MGDIYLGDEACKMELVLNVSDTVSASIIRTDFDE